MMSSHKWLVLGSFIICGIQPACAQVKPVAPVTPVAVVETPAPAATATGPLVTRWAKEVTPTNALPEYPRPQMTRKNWLNLNGQWDYTLTDKTATASPTGYNDKILVPFAYESLLSGVHKPSVPNQRLWYRRTFEVPATWKGQRVLLHFGAVNYDSEVLVNGKSVGKHRGGFDSFDFDVTDALKAGSNTLVVTAVNGLDDRTQVLGKQRTSSGGIFYTGVTGIWQTVWLEPVPTAYIKSLKATPDVDGQQLRLTTETSGPATVKVTALDGSKAVASVTGDANKELTLPVKNPVLWSPDSPHLYSLKVELVQSGKTGDSVDSYFAMRKISLGKDEQGRTRIFLNNKFVFQVGALDQGYWPDGLYTAPTDAALKYDIEAAKKLGFNLLRKHAKVEPARWYYWTDKLGMLVWQDMPQMFADERTISEETKKQFEMEWREEMAEFHHFPSIVVWTTFNEGWGQHDTERIAKLTKELDPSRLVNSASGWTDKGVGDIHDTHDYRGPGSNTPEANRAAVCGEFGGLALPVVGHRWNNDIFGYGAVIRNPWELTSLYQELLKKAYALRDQKGASAVVYTQIADVEQEINGLMTYDREVIKPYLDITSGANQGKFPAMPANPNSPDIILVPTAQDSPINWSYTTEKPADNWMQTAFDASAWKTGPAPFGRELNGMRTIWGTPDIWIRREVTLPDKIPANLSFSIFHDEDAEIYLNGVLAGSPKGYNSGYDFVPLNAAGQAALKPGKNTIAVHVHQTIGGQYIDIGILQVSDGNK